MSPIRKILDFSFPGWMLLRHIGILALLGVLSVFVAPDTGSARVFKVFGLEDFVRPCGGPATEVREFQVKNPNDSEFNLHLFMGLAAAPRSARQTGRTFYTYASVLEMTAEGNIPALSFDGMTFNDDVIERKEN